MMIGCKDWIALKYKAILLLLILPTSLYALPIRPADFYGFAQKGSQVRHHPVHISSEKNQQRPHLADHRASFRYSGTLVASIVSLDRHLDVLAVTCESDGLKIWVADPEIITDWHVGAPVVGGPMWGCKISAVDVQQPEVGLGHNHSFHRTIRSVDVSEEHPNLILVHTSIISFTECFEDIDINFNSVLTQPVAVQATDIEDSLDGQWSTPTESLQDVGRDSHNRTLHDSSRSRRKDGTHSFKVDYDSDEQLSGFPPIVFPQAPILLYNSNGGTVTCTDCSAYVFIGVDFGLQATSGSAKSKIKPTVTGYKLIASVLFQDLHAMVDVRGKLFGGKSRSTLGTVTKTKTLDIDTVPFDFIFSVSLDVEFNTVTNMFGDFKFGYYYDNRKFIFGNTINDYPNTPPYALQVLQTVIYGPGLFSKGADPNYEDSYPSPIDVGMVMPKSSMWENNIAASSMILSLNPKVSLSLGKSAGGYAQTMTLSLVIPLWFTALSGSLSKCRKYKDITDRTMTPVSYSSSFELKYLLSLSKVTLPLLSGVYSYSKGLPSRGFFKSMLKKRKLYCDGCKGCMIQEANGNNVIVMGLDHRRDVNNTVNASIDAAYQNLALAVPDTAWSECSVVCGGGWQTRQVRCKDMNGTLLPFSSCKYGVSEATQQRCNIFPCRGDIKPEPTPNCTVACPKVKQGNGVCDEACNFPKFNYDNGDCFDWCSAYADCSSCLSARSLTCAWCADSYSSSGRCVDTIARLSQCTNPLLQCVAPEPPLILNISGEIILTNNSLLVPSMSFMVGSNMTLSWSGATNKSYISLEFSNDDGTNWWAIPSLGSVPVSSRNTVWTLPLTLLLLANVTVVRAVSSTSSTNVGLTVPFTVLGRTGINNVTYAWQVSSSLSPCSSECGGDGVASRTVICVSSENRTEIDQNLCLEPRPDSFIPCNTDTNCPTYKYVVTDWSECKGNASGCGLGVSTREVACESSLGTYVLFDYCFGSAPVNSSACEIEVPCERALFFTLTFPPSAEHGLSINFTWQGGSDSTPIQLAFTADGGLTYQPMYVNKLPVVDIPLLLENTGSYNWTVPYDFPTSGPVNFVISSSLSPSNSYTSTPVFFVSVDQLIVAFSDDSADASKTGTLGLIIGSVVGAFVLIAIILMVSYRRLKLGAHQGSSLALKPVNTVCKLLSDLQITNPATFAAVLHHRVVMHDFAYMSEQDALADFSLNSAELARIIRFIQTTPLHATDMNMVTSSEF